MREFIVKLSAGWWLMKYYYYFLIALVINFVSIAALLSSVQVLVFVIQLYLLFALFIYAAIVLYSLKRRLKYAAASAIILFFIFIADALFVSFQRSNGALGYALAILSLISSISSVFLLLRLHRQLKIIAFVRKYKNCKQD